MLNFYLNICSDILNPLNDLLRKNQPVKWGKSQQAAFEKCKDMINKGVTLTHYGSKVIVAADASPYGLGAILSLIEDGVCKPVQFASCTLSPANRNYREKLMQLCLQFANLQVFVWKKNVHNFV